MKVNADEFATRISQDKNFQYSFLSEKFVQQMIVTSDLVIAQYQTCTKPEGTIAFVDRETMDLVKEFEGPTDSRNYGHSMERMPGLGATNLWFTANKGGKISLNQIWAGYDKGDKEWEFDIISDRFNVTASSKDETIDLLNMSRTNQLLLTDQNTQKASILEVQVCPLNYRVVSYGTCEPCPRDTPVNYWSDVNKGDCVSCYDVFQYLSGTNPQVKAAYNAVCKTDNDEQDDDGTDDYVRRKEPGNGAESLVVMASTIGSVIVAALV